MSRLRNAAWWQQLVLTVGLSLLVLGAAACRPTASGKTAALVEPAATATVPIDLPVTIALAGSFTNPVLQALDAQIADFEAANPDLRVEIVRAPKAADRHQTWVGERLRAGDTSIDLYVLEPTWAAELANRRWLVPLNRYLSSAEGGIVAYLPGAVKANTFDGQVMALPWSADASLLYYRRDMLDRLGYEPPETWAELQQMALAAKESENLPYGYLWPGVAGETLTCVTLESVWCVDPQSMAGGLRATFDHPGAEVALEQVFGLVASGASPANVAAWDEEQVLTAFRNGEAAFMRGGFSAWGYLNSQDSAIAGQVGIAQLPGACLSERALALSVHSLRPDMAWRFLAFLVGHEQQVQMALASGQPPASEVAYRDTALVRANPAFGSLYSALQAARTRPPDPDYATISTAIATEVNRMLAGDQTAAAAARAIRRRLAGIPPR